MTTTADLATFRAPPGSVAMTLDLHKCEPVTIVVPADCLVALMAGVEDSLPTLTTTTGVARHLHLRSYLQQGLRRAQRAGSERNQETLGLLALWLALNHPDAASAMRQQVAEQLRLFGRAHVTIACNRRQAWGFALADQFASLGAALSTMGQQPADTTVAWARPLAERVQH